MYLAIKNKSLAFCIYSRVQINHKGRVNIHVDPAFIKITVYAFDLKWNQLNGAEATAPLLISSPALIL